MFVAILAILILLTEISVLHQHKIKLYVPSTVPTNKHVTISRNNSQFLLRLQSLSIIRVLNDSSNTSLPASAKTFRTQLHVFSQINNAAANSFPKINTFRVGSCSSTANRSI